MPKKTTIFIIILGLITVGLIYLAFRTQQDETPQVGPDVTPTQEELQATATLYFEENQVVASQGTQTSVDILLDSGNQLAQGAQVYLEYDPSQISVNSITAPQDNFFGADASEYIVLESDVQLDESGQELGVATYIISTPPQTDPTTSVTSKPLTGIDRIATVTFTPIAGTTGTSTIAIMTAPNTSIVTSPNPNFLTESILLDATPLQVTIQ